MIKYFVKWELKKPVKGANSYSDGYIDWQAAGIIEGHMRMLSASERVSTGDILSTHRFYTKERLEHGWKLVRDNEEYHVTVSDHKSIPTSNLNFYQVDCERVR